MHISYSLLILSFRLHNPRRPPSIAAGQNRVAREAEDDLRLSEAERHNRSVHVNRLPPEVLSLILREILPILPPDGLRPDEDFGFTGVCRYWRDVALNTPEIWSGIPNDVSMDMIQMFLTRSRNAPVTIVVGPNTEYAAAMVSMALPHIGHTKHLSLNTLLSAQDLEYLSLPAPLLSVCIIGHQGARLPRLPDDFLGLCAPRLRRLHIYHASFSWTMMHCTSLIGGLRSLELAIIPADSLPSGSQFYKALRSMPWLENLVIRSGALQVRIPESMDAGDNPEEVITLGRLTALELYGPGQFVGNLLCRFKVPPTSSVILSLCNPDGIWSVPSWPNSTWENFLEGHASFRPGSFPCLVYHLTHWECYLACSSRVETVFDPKPLLHLTAPPYSILYLLRKLPMESVEILQVDAYRLHDPAFMKQVLGYCGSVSELRIADCIACETIFPVLGPSRQRDPGLLPALRRIQFLRGCPQMHEKVARGLLVFLAQRAATGGRSLEISVPRECDPRDAKMLRDTVGERAQVIVRA